MTTLAQVMGLSKPQTIAEKFGRPQTIAEKFGRPQTIAEKFGTPETLAEKIDEKCDGLSKKDEILTKGAV